MALTSLTDPLIMDKEITVTFKKISITNVWAHSTSTTLWWFLVDYPGGAPTPGAEFDHKHPYHPLVSSSSIFGHEVSPPDAPTLAAFTPRVHASDALDKASNCWGLPLGASTQYEINLNHSTRFSLQEGSSFRVWGEFAPMSSVSTDCGDWPYFIPSESQSSCLAEFDKTYEYKDVGENSAVVTEIIERTAGASDCDFSIAIQIE